MTEPGGRRAAGTGGRPASPPGTAAGGTRPGSRDTAAGSAGSGGAQADGSGYGLRPHFTGRAAILAIVICAIALSLAYPVREYIAQRRQIDQLLDQRSQIGLRLRQLEREKRQLSNPVYIERLARDRLHMCLPTQMCYVIISPARRSPASTTARQDSVPWYVRLWSSVQQANHPQPAAGHPGQRKAAPAGSRQRGPARGDTGAGRPAGPAPG